MKKLFIAKSEWFSRRKYLGWGVGIKTWQGGVYIAAFIGLLMLSSALVNITNNYSLYAGAVIFLFFTMDIFFVMSHLQNDEREKIHEAIAERNAVWGMMIVLIAGILFEAIYYGLQEQFHVNPFIAGALVIGLVIKSITNYKLDKEN